MKEEVIVSDPKLEKKYKAQKKVLQRFVIKNLKEAMSADEDDDGRLTVEAMVELGWIPKELWDEDAPSA